MKTAAIFGRPHEVLLSLTNPVQRSPDALVWVIRNINTHRAVLFIGRLKLLCTQTDRSVKLQSSTELLYLSHLEIMEVCSYIHMQLGPVALHNHRTSVCGSMEIMYRSMLQQLSLGNKTIIYLPDDAYFAFCHCHWRVQRPTLMADLERIGN